MHQVSTIQLSEQAKADLLEVGLEVGLELGDRQRLATADFESINLSGHRPVLVVIGGASQLSDDIFSQIQGFFGQVLAPIAERLQAVVVDGGTDAGVMRLMGQARAQIGGTFPLVGVAPRGLVMLPGESALTGQHTALEPHHTHFILVPGAAWGDESMALAQVATGLAAGSPTIAVMLNGGAITWLDAANNVGEGRSLVVINGTGRAADELAAVVRGAVGSAQAQAIAKTGLVTVVDLTASHELIVQQLEAILTIGKL
jgi:SLOG in TRPM, prokaryote